VTAPRRRVGHFLRPNPAIALALGIALVAAACGSTAPATTRPSASAPAASPGLTAVPGGNASPAAGPSVQLPATTDTEFGTIFDALPPSFPKLPGQEPAETGAGATSGSFAVNLSAANASAAIASALAEAGWGIDVGDPLEDGSIVLAATHAPAGCKTEVRFTPLSGTVIMSVLYGASCPFG
jgi:hypothetical protein